MKKIILLLLLLFSILSQNFMIITSADENKDWHIIDSWSLSFSNRTAVPLYPDLIISVAEEYGNSFDIEWKTNATGHWEIFAYNLSCDNGTYSQIAKWANQSETTYWWSYTLNIDSYSNDSELFNFTTTKYPWGDWSEPWVFSYVPQETRVNTFSPVAFGESGMTFSLSLDIVAEDYHGPIIINVSTRTIEDIVYPLNIEGENGKYIIKDLIFEVFPPPSKNQFNYPFDSYWVNLTFYTSSGERLNFSTVSTEEKVIPQWKMKMQWNGNKLRLDFERNQEVNAFWILLSVGIISILLRVIWISLWKGIISTVMKITHIIESKIDLKSNSLAGRLYSVLTKVDNIAKSKNGWRHGLLDILHYVGDVISIPFYFGVIFSYIIYTCPQSLTKSSLYLIPLLLGSIILGGVVFKYQREKNGGCNCV